MGKHVKLYLTRHEREETIIESFPAKDWGDFLIISLQGFTSEDQYAQFSQVLQNYSEKMDKEIIVIPMEWDVEMYGVEIEDPSQ